jgi:hypothetical protein
MPGLELWRWRGALRILDVQKYTRAKIDYNEKYLWD